jgi:hypothetical protein
MVVVSRASAGGTLTRGRLVRLKPIGDFTFDEAWSP